jgi:proline dehydrogenase
VEFSLWQRTRGGAATRLDCYLSIKGPPLGSSAALAGAIVEHATAAGVRVHVDAMAWEEADATFEMLDSIRPLAPRLGCTLPGRWGRSVDDAEQAVEQHLDVRVVKGQWADPTEPGRDERRGFLEVVERLAGRAPHVAIATHDAPLASSALRRLQQAGTPCELEVLLGWPSRRALAVAPARRLAARLYVPYGAPHLPYEPSVAVTWRFLGDVARGQLGQFLQPLEESVRDRSGTSPATLHVAR